MKSNTNRPAEKTGHRELLTAFYAEFNHVVTGRGCRDEVASLVADGVVWTRATSDTAPDPNYTGVDELLENVAGSIRDETDHLQALPERFIDAGETVVVSGAYVGIDDGTDFDVPFVHVHELEDGCIQRCQAYREVDPHLDPTAADRLASDRRTAPTVPTDESYPPHTHDS